MGKCKVLFGKNGEIKGVSPTKEFPLLPFSVVRLPTTDVLKVMSENFIVNVPTGGLSR